MGVGAVEVAFGPGVEIVGVYGQLFLGGGVVRVEGELRHQLYYYYRCYRSYQVLFLIL